jgi:hypothetical protein
VNPRAGLDDVEKKKFLNSDPSVFQPVASRYTDYPIMAPIQMQLRIRLFRRNGEAYNFVITKGDVILANAGYLLYSKSTYWNCITK